LALLLPLTELQGDITGLVGTNDISKTQLDTGNIEMPTFIAAVKESGAIDVTLEQGEDHDAQDNNTKCHQGTQTEMVSLSFYDFKMYEPVKGQESKIW